MVRRSLLAMPVVLVALASCGGGDATTTVAGPPVTSIPPFDTTTTTGTPGTTSTTTTTLPPSLAEPPVFDRWTTILASLPVEDWDEGAATEEAFSLIELQTGLLLSSEYPSLNAGYWVVFSGDFATQEEALSHCRALQASGVSCYHRYLGEAPVVIAGRDVGSLVAWVDGELAVVDASTGAIVEAVTDAYIGGVFPGAVELTHDGTGVYFGMGFEDYWYSCDASAGRVDHVDLTSGESTEIAAGFGPKLSPDGSRLAYIASTHCIPDPDNDGEVISFADAVAVLDLVSGRVQTWGPSPGVAETPASFVASIAWNAEGTQVYVAMDRGDLRVIDMSVGAAVDAAPRLGPGRADVAFGTWTLEAVASSSGNLVAVETDFETSQSRLIEISVDTGLVVRAGEWSDGFQVARFDRERSALLVTGSGTVQGAPAGALGPAPWFDGADW